MSEGKSNFTVQLVPFLVVLLVIVSFFAGGLWTKLKNNENNNQVQGVQTQQTQDQTGQTTTTTAALTPDGTDGTFYYQNGLSICKSDGKPVIYLFSTTWCPHCSWIKDTFDKVAKEYVEAGKIVAYHWELDTNDNTLTSEVETQVPTDAQAAYTKFNPDGSIPTFVFGCKYWRVGNGYESQSDLTSEETEFRALFDKLVASN
ncbi:hypothetical protein CO015_00495 [candidate division WWE3 bacterium CG_4_8_14_3_um_filter_42_11]|uniref:Thioredoxin domain-containing protein n=3 Tax=Katanobacteria TaxID=422282 RepID=A0A2M7TB83_UNCKA|nr:MAG: hypothetical protein AUJ38_00810 [bacterium CG1_02_42_9]PIZ42370.1 MAG: hypothetical protein COY34_02955 [candidate division WWE3 bacterium CG_4_10_14_0_2_um_filter_42_8]PJA37957.1 MAG: hypothetical protein CO181_01535 [candidate division WWE3 bacterium CG_4_9_14_3_um_filter_43_9]PJC69350.1 MAG: hypothetical protein CO015_00495 [candidate division WWE3 bacterium CG_4_8_14_3_um_filter_42_11]